MNEPPNQFVNIVPSQRSLSNKNLRHLGKTNYSYDRLQVIRGKMQFFIHLAPVRTVSADAQPTSLLHRPAQAYGNPPIAHAHGAINLTISNGTSTNLKNTR